MEIQKIILESFVQALKLSWGLALEVCIHRLIQKKFQYLLLPDDGLCLSVIKDAEMFALHEQKHCNL